MINIGLKLKEKREENGVSVEEVSEDLKVRPSQIINLEEGKRESFKDVVFLKYLIRDYAKYLGLDSDKLVDEFNEFLFDYTSKISLEDIEKAKLGIVNKKEVVSPYTNNNNNKRNLKISIAIVGAILLLIVSYFVIGNFNRNDFNNDNITYVIRR